VALFVLSRVWLASAARQSSLIKQEARDLTNPFQCRKRQTDKRDGSVADF
jgi:hypothetical protein